MKWILSYFLFYKFAGTFLDTSYPLLADQSKIAVQFHFSSETIFRVPSNILTKAWYVSIVHQFISHKFWDDILPENWRLAPEDNVVMRVKPVTAHDHCLQLCLTAYSI